MLSDFNESLIFSREFRKTITKLSRKPIRWKSICSMRTDGRTDGRTDRQIDMTNLRVAFYNFANLPKMRLFL